LENGLVSEKRANVTRWLTVYAKIGTTSGEGACIRRGPICCEIAYMQREGTHLENGLIFEEGQYVMRWLICKERDNIWRRGLYLKTANMS